MPRPVRHSRLVLGAALLLAAVALLVFDPADHGFFPRCLFHSLTGWKCAGCGAQRMTHSLLQLDIAEAFRQNALLVLLLPYFALLLAAPLLRARWPRLHTALTGRTAVVAAAWLAVGWTVARNVWGW